MANYDVMIARQDSAPDEKRLVLAEESVEELLCAALRKWLQLGAVLVKDAAIKGRETLQFAPGTTPGFTGIPQPAVGQSFSPFNTPDVFGTQGDHSGVYIVTFVAEAASMRYTTSGRDPTTTFGMLVPAGVIVEMTLQDWNALRFAGQTNCIINVELFQVDA